MNDAAAQIASWPSAQLGSVDATRGSSDMVDLSQSVIALLEGELSAQANLNVIHSADEMQKSLIDLLG